MANDQTLVRDRVLDELRAHLGRGGIAPGARLLEADVVRAYGVSRSLAQVRVVIDAYPDVRGADLDAIEHDLHVDLLGACHNQ